MAPADVFTGKSFRQILTSKCHCIVDIKIPLPVNVFSISDCFIGVNTFTTSPYFDTRFRSEISYISLAAIGIVFEKRTTL